MYKFLLMPMGKHFEPFYCVAREFLVYYAISIASLLHQPTAARRQTNKSNTTCFLSQQQSSS